MVGLIGNIFVEYDLIYGWQYSVEATYVRFQEMYPEAIVTFPFFIQHCMRIIERFLSTRSVQKKIT